MSTEGEAAQNSPHPEGNPTTAEAPREHPVSRILTKAKERIGKAIQRPERSRHRSLAEILRESNGPLKKISPVDFAVEMIRLSHAQDSDGMHELFDELLGWETRLNGMKRPGHPKPTPRSADVIREDVLRNLDAAAELADHSVLGGASDVGPVREFYREVIKYNPPDETDPRSE